MAYGASGAPHEATRVGGAHGKGQPTRFPGEQTATEVQREDKQAAPYGDVREFEEPTQRQHHQPHRRAEAFGAWSGEAHFGQMPAGGVTLHQELACWASL